MTILSNAVMSIQVGLEDLTAGTPSRTLSAIRNLHAGVVLLLKARLVELSPAGSDEVLLKQRIKPRRAPAGQLEFVGAGKKTVELDAIRERLEALGAKVDWKRMDRLTQERNNVEHYYTQMPDKAIHALAADVFIIVRDFTVRELMRDPSELFGGAAWQQLLANGEVFEAERTECLEALRKVEWGSVALAQACEDYGCAECGGRLWLPVDPSRALDDLQLQCRCCGHRVEADEFVQEALEQHLPYDPGDGGTGDLAMCPDCLQETFVVSEDVCARCGYQRAYDTCLRCGASLDIDEQEFEGVCGYCSHMMSKDD
jgi:DNA-directed RNA polymerase subunit RPC12/RpoP